MSSDAGLAATEIAPPGRAPRPLGFGLGLARLPPGVLARIGETFATRLSTLHGALSMLGPLPASQQVSLDVARAEIGRLEYLGVRVQEIARILGGEAPLPSERIDLARALRETLDAWSPAAQVAAVTLESSDESCDVEVNAAVLDQLLNLVLECALHTGPKITIAAAAQGRPVRPTLTLRVERPAGARGGDVVEDLGDVHWTLFALLARAAGLLPQRLAAGRSVTLMLGFPERTAGAAAGAMDDGLARTAAPTGRHVLLIEPQELARLTAYDLMHDAGMWIESVASLEQAHDGLRDGAPDVIVTGIPIDEPRFAGLLEQMRAAQPRLRLVQLVDDDDAFAFSVPGSDMPAQVGRNSMARTLVRAVAQELDAAWSD